MKKLIFMVSILVFCFAFINGCTGEDDPDECEIFCDEMTHCSEMMDQPFSRASCERKCRDDLQAYDLIGCEDDFLDLLECRSDISCTDANDVGNECAGEIDDLNHCL